MLYGTERLMIPQAVPTFSVSGLEALDLRRNSSVRTHRSISRPTMPSQQCLGSRKLCNPQQHVFRSRVSEASQRIEVNRPAAGNLHALPSGAPSVTFGTPSASIARQPFSLGRAQGATMHTTLSVAHRNERSI